MKHSSNISTGPESLTPFSSIGEAVTAFATTHNLQRLERIAAGRLNRLASLPPGQRLRALRDPAEFVNQAIEHILTGRRKARPQNLANFDAFRNFVQGVMQSIINHAMESVIRQGNQVPVELLHDREGNEHALATNNLNRDILLREAKESLFPRLREYAQEKPELLKTIQVWEESWPLSDRIPKCDLTDKQTHELRLKVRQFLRESAAKDGIAQPTGKEPLML